MVDEYIGDVAFGLMTLLEKISTFGYVTNPMASYA
ncbi:hypothetical protein ACOMICROBIO_FLGHMIGD_04275 [Vibrio sp. B1FLJ16]|nr:hypothetical protein ACOMICROBIO_FLGHMIGD_04275 [Vibrio sp. B1FLJ16]CAE6944767.1 hypothetical protein ACOMICROBIO_FLGHMIGD_04275 [Vibrio sp. B1FLJ16]